MLYCTNCGRELPDDSSFCNACGQPVCRDAGPDMSAGNQPYMQSAAPYSAILVGIFAFCVDYVFQAAYYGR